jgi:hypothetical protein
MGDGVGLSNSQRERPVKSYITHLECTYCDQRYDADQLQTVLAGIDDRPVTGKKGHGPVPVDKTVDQVRGESLQA